MEPSGFRGPGEFSVSRGTKRNTELGKWEERVSFPSRLCAPSSNTGALPSPWHRQQTAGSERWSHCLQLPSEQHRSYGPSLGESPWAPRSQFLAGHLMGTFFTGSSQGH